MPPLVTLEQVWQQLRIEPDTDQELIEGLVAAATRAVEINTGRTVAGGPATLGEADATIAAQAVLMIVTAWYDNRDSAEPNAHAAGMPPTVHWLLWPLKRLVV